MAVAQTTFGAGLVTALPAEKLAKAMVANPKWAERLGWGAYGAAIATLVGVAGTEATEAGFAQGVANWQSLNSQEVDGIIGPNTWGALRGALSPPTSLTGISPPALPRVPNGFDEVLATFGDPRPFISPDGRISSDNETLWQRQTLSRGKLPFAIPLDAANAGAGMKTTFYAHRKLVGVFEAVFEEIARLGLRQQVRSWGGIYNFRPIRGTSSTLSLHCFGAAIDLNAETNQMGSAGNMDASVVDVFEHFGFFWGGRFRGRPDPMHFQYATGC